MIQPPSKTKDIMQWCGHPSSSANIAIKSVHTMCLASRAHSEVFIGTNQVCLHYSPTSRATRHSLMESQHASKLLIPLLTVGFMAPPREAVLERCSSDFIAAAVRAVVGEPMLRKSNSRSQSPSWSHDLASLFHHRARDAL